MDHDQNFKNLIVDYPRDAIALFAASAAAEIDPDARITPIRQEQLKERVVPVVVFLHRGAFRQDLRLGSDAQDHLQCNFLSFSLAKEPAERHLHSRNLVARLNLPNMAYLPAAKVDIYEQAMRGLVMWEADHGRRAKYTDFIDMYAALDENEWATYLARSAKEGDMAVSFRQKMEEQGLQKGLQQGLEQGAHDGAGRLLLRLIALQFGDEASADVRDRVEAADLETIMAWSDRILTAGSLEDVFR